MWKFLLILLLLSSCTRYKGREVFVSKNLNYRLFLYSDGTYRFRYPGFLGRGEEHGIFNMRHDTVALLREIKDGWELSHRFRRKGHAIVLCGMDPKVTPCGTLLLKY